jgi:hypothetical protein
MYKETVDNLMKTEGLTPESILFRYTNSHHVISNSAGETIIKANPDSQEMVVNHYENGYITSASSLGHGLAFALSMDSRFKSADRVCVSVRLGDILEQNGVIYKDQSSGEPDSWFLTMPKGEVKVKIV